MSKTLDEILNVQAANGPFGPGNAVMEQTLRDFIQLQSTLIAVGTQVVGVRTVDWLTFKWYTGVDGTFTYPVDDNAVVEPTRIGTASYEVSLAKGQGRTIFLDSTLLRGESFETLDRQQLAIVRNRADIIDDLILEKLIDGAGQSVAVASGKESLADHLRRVANLTVLYSRNSRLADTALLLVPGAETAEFFQYNGPGFMETELTRIPGVGYDWILSGYMGSVIHEHQDGAAGGKNNRICKITNISA